MRVVAGTHRGRRLAAPKGRATRPTSDRVREALFSMLGPLDGAPSSTADAGGARVLDLFAGSGALGIEALSRGARSAVFVDRAAAAIEAVRANLAALELDGELRREDALTFVRRASSAGGQYDLVFLDPPYEDAEHLVEVLSTPLRRLLAPGARVVVESRRDAADVLGGSLELLRERRYGDTLIRLYEAGRCRPISE